MTNQAEPPSALPDYRLRQSHLTSNTDKTKFTTLVLNPGPSLVYFTGLHFHLSERPVVAIFKTGEPIFLALPELEAAKVSNLPYPVEVFPYGEDPATWAAIFQKAAQAAGLGEGAVGVEPTRLRYLELSLLQKAAPAAGFISAEEELAAIRMCKEESELAAMRKAVDIAQKALQATLPIVKPGVSELEIAAELTLHLLRNGSDTEFPFSPIVSGGPNSANPHATPSGRKLQNGDLLVIDWGASVNGYASDLTRTFAIGDVEPELQKITAIVLAANAAARQKAGPGITASEVDQAARDVIEEAGYGKYFTHRTGHGLGLEGHEPPYIRSGNPLALKPGMTFTIEPGIYLPQRNGVRIEDNIVITGGGVECLSNLPRELIRI